jgi:4a-hydroxytetrahydrobiopterin dehydratase
MSDSLLELKCIPCRGDEPHLAEAQVAALLPQIADWKMVTVDGTPRLERVFRFKNFRQALDFTVRIGELAEAEGHHPALLTEWGRVTVTWWTHKIQGLHQNDFIMAAKTDALYHP